MHGNKGKEGDENQKVQKGKEEVVLQPPPEKGASVEVSTLLSSSNLRPLLSSPSLVSEPEALATASAACMSKVEKDETKYNDKSETKKGRPGLQVGILCLFARFPFTPHFCSHLLSNMYSHVNQITCLVFFLLHFSAYLSILAPVVLG